MAVKHLAIRAVRHAGEKSPDRIFISSAAVIKGAPVVFSSGKVVTVTDAAGGPAGRYVGFATHATTAADQDQQVTLCMPGQEFIGSLTSLAAGGTSAGGKALALSDIGTIVEIHLDAGTGIWVLGATGGDDVAALITGLIDPVGATDDDTPTFGATSGGGVGATGQQNPTGTNTGMALVRFQIVTHSGVTLKVKTIF